MGTSINQSSPHTLGWSAAQAGYSNDKIPIPRVATEVWRAAVNQEIGNVAQLIAQPIVARIGALAIEAKSAADLSHATARLLSQSKQSSLGTEIARRAAIQCLSFPVRADAYAERVFAEATAYLVSRDLPGFVGLGRTQTVGDSMEFRSAVMNHVVNLARTVEQPKTFDSKSWATHVRNVVKRLRSQDE